MLIFQLEKPLEQKDIDDDFNNNQKKSQLALQKMQIVGLFVIVLTLIIGYFWGVRFNSDDFGKMMVLYLPITFGLFCISHPYMRKWMGGERIDKFDYLAASISTIHNCKAFINMPGMEKYKEYVKQVELQGRNLINFECSSIIKYYESLAK